MIQAEDRLHRRKQRSTVDVYYLLSWSPPTELRPPRWSQWELERWRLIQVIINSPSVVVPCQSM